VGTHLVPEHRAHRHPIDEQTVCTAIEGIGGTARTTAWAARFALLREPGRPDDGTLPPRLRAAPEPRHVGRLN
jgi:hypothetical protein